MSNNLLFFTSEIGNYFSINSTMLRDDVEAQEEFADERVKGIMEVYEKRLERIQRKVDEDDEWVSSMLYYQEQTKVEVQ